MGKWDERGLELATSLEGVSDERRIKNLATQTMQEVIDACPGEGSIKRPRAALRKAIETAFPSQNVEDDCPKGYYRTSEGKGKGERYVHLALWYLTTNTDRWDVVGDKARQQYWGNLPTLGESESKPQQTKRQPKTNKTKMLRTEKQPKRAVSIMSRLNLNLDSETQEAFDFALKQTGLDEKEFITRAIASYSKSIANRHEVDLSAISTEKLLNDPSCAKLPGRAEELTRRSVRAISIYNDEIAPENSERWAITQSAISRLTGGRASSIQKALEGFQGMIEDHHQKYELNNYSNRKSGGRSIEDTIDIAELVPDGLDL